MNLKDRTEMAALIEEYLRERGDPVGTLTAGMVREHHGLPPRYGSMIGWVLNDEVGRAFRNMLPRVEIGHSINPRYVLVAGGRRVRVYTYKMQDLGDESTQRGIEKTPL